MDRVERARLRALLDAEDAREAAQREYEKARDYELNLRALNARPVYKDMSLGDEYRYVTGQWLDPPERPAPPPPVLSEDREVILRAAHIICDVFDVFKSRFLKGNTIDNVDKLKAGPDW